MDCHALEYLSVRSIRMRRSGCVGGNPKWRKEGRLFWDPSIKGERAREPRGAHLSLTRRSPWLTLLARCEVLRRHDVGEREGELGADFGSLVLPRFLSGHELFLE